MVDVEKDLVQVVQFPEFEDKPGSAIELYKEHPVDTLERDGRHLKLRKRYTLAAFEEGKWNLGRPAVLYADKNIVDTLWARDSLYLQVATFQIDSTSQSIYDVKPQWNLPFRFGEVSGYAQWGALALVLLLAGGLCAEALPGEPRQTPRRPCSGRHRPSPPARRGDQGAGGTAPPEVVAEQQAQAILFGTDGHPAHLRRGTVGLRRHGDDLGRDHRDDARGGTARQGPDGSDGDPGATPTW